MFFWVFGVVGVDDDLWYRWFVKVFWLEMVWFGNKCFDFGVGVDCVDFFLIFGIFCEYV